MIFNNCVKTLYSVEEMGMKNLKKKSLELDNQDKETFLTQSLWFCKQY